MTPFRGAQALARLPEPGADVALARLVERLPVGLLVHRGDEVLLANRHLLVLSGYDSPEALAAAGGPGVIFRGRDPSASAGPGEGARSPSRRGAAAACRSASPSASSSGTARPRACSRSGACPMPTRSSRWRRPRSISPHRDANLRETTAILDAVTDGVVVLDDEGRILSMNRGAQGLLGADPREVAGESLIGLFSPESRPAAQAALLRASAGATATTGDEVMARGPDGPLPLILTLAPVASGPPRRVAAVLRDVSASRRTEAELVRARREAERASAQKSDFLATISHEVRTPLNAIIGFAEVMLEEQFGPVGSERYRDYLRDIRASGEHVVSLVNDLLDLAKIEAGHLDSPAFAGPAPQRPRGGLGLLMQPQAARQRVVMRTSFAAGLPAVLADQRSLRQATLNVISNAIKFTDAGGQVIVSTAATDRGGVALRVRDTGIGMSPEEIETALQPFRQIATAQRRGGGTGLGLPLTKALVEANRASLRITSRKGEGTLVEMLFPAARVLDS